MVTIDFYWESYYNKDEVMIMFEVIINACGFLSAYYLDT